VAWLLLLQLLLWNLVDQHSLGVLAFQVSCLLNTSDRVFLLRTQILQISKVERDGHLLLLLFLLLVKVIVVLWLCHLFIGVALSTIIALLLVDYLNLRFGWCSTLSLWWANFNRSRRFLLFNWISLVVDLISGKLWLVILVLLLRLLWLLSIALIRFDVLSTDGVRPICPVEENLVLLVLMNWLLGCITVSSKWCLLLRWCLVFDRMAVGVLLLLKLPLMYLLSRN